MYYNSEYHTSVIFGTGCAAFLQLSSQSAHKKIQCPNQDNRTLTILVLALAWDVRLVRSVPVERFEVGRILDCGSLKEIVYAHRVRLKNRGNSDVERVSTSAFRRSYVRLFHGPSRPRALVHKFSWIPENACRQGVCRGFR